jgi:hypothetical protein
VLEPQSAVGQHAIDAGARCLRDEPHVIVGVLHHQLAPGIDVSGVGPALVELFDVEFEVDV